MEKWATREGQGEGDMRRKRGEEKGREARIKRGKDLYGNYTRD